MIRRRRQFSRLSINSMHCALGENWEKSRSIPEGCWLWESAIIRIARSIGVRWLCYSWQIPLRSLRIGDTITYVELRFRIWHPFELFQNSAHYHDCQNESQYITHRLRKLNAEKSDYP